MNVNTFFLLALAALSCAPVRAEQTTASDYFNDLYALIVGPEKVVRAQYEKKHDEEMNMLNRRIRMARSQSKEIAGIYDRARSSYINDEGKNQEERLCGAIRALSERLEPIKSSFQLSKGYLTFWKWQWHSQLLLAAIFIAGLRAYHLQDLIEACEKEMKDVADDFVVIASEAEAIETNNPNSSALEKVREQCAQYRSSLKKTLALKRMSMALYVIKTLYQNGQYLVGKWEESPYVLLQKIVPISVHGIGYWATGALGERLFGRSKYSGLKYGARVTKLLTEIVALRCLSYLALFSGAYAFSAMKAQCVH